jgi:hypothetical protein
MTHAPLIHNTLHGVSAVVLAWLLKERTHLKEKHMNLETIIEDVTSDVNKAKQLGPQLTAVFVAAKALAAAVEALEAAYSPPAKPAA